MGDDADAPKRVGMDRWYHQYRRAYGCASHRRCLKACSPEQGRCPPPTRVVRHGVRQLDRICGGAVVLRRGSPYVAPQSLLALADSSASSSPYVQRTSLTVLLRHFSGSSHEYVPLCLE